MATFKIEFGDKHYTFDPSKDITLSALRHAKGWYGSELGSYTKLISAFGAGDPDAIAVVIWICRTIAGEVNIPTAPMMEDFSIGEFLADMEFVEDVDPDPTPVVDDPSTTGDLTPMLIG